MFAYENTCYYKSRDDIPLETWNEAVSGAINTCYYTKISPEGSSANGQQEIGSQGNGQEEIGSAGKKEKKEKKE